MLEHQSGNRSILFRLVDTDMSRSCFVDFLLNCFFGESGVVAISRQMSHENVLQLVGYQMPGRFPCGEIAEMSVAACDALFDAPWAFGVFLEELEVIISLQDQGIGRAYSVQYQSGCVAQVRQEADIAARSPYQETNRVLSVMGNGKRFDFHIADIKRLPCLEDVGVELCLGLAGDGVKGEPVCKHRDTKLGGNDLESLSMIRVLVCDQYAVQQFRGAIDFGQPFSDLFAAETCIDQQAHSIRFQIGAIASGTASQNGQSKGHSCRLVGESRIRQRNLTVFSKNELLALIDAWMKGGGRSHGRSPPVDSIRWKRSGSSLKKSVKSCGYFYPVPHHGPEDGGLKFFLFSV